MSSEDETDPPPKPHRDPASFQTDGFFPRVRVPLEKQVQEHHEVLHRHGRQFANVFVWQRDLSSRVQELEENDASKAIAAFRAEFRGAKRVAGYVIASFSAFWTIVVTIATILLAVYR